MDFFIQIHTSGSVIKTARLKIVLHKCYEEHFILDILNVSSYCQRFVQFSSVHENPRFSFFFFLFRFCTHLSIFSNNYYHRYQAILQHTFESACCLSRKMAVKTTRPRYTLHFSLFSLRSFVLHCVTFNLMDVVYNDCRRGVYSLLYIGLEYRARP